MMHFLAVYSKEVTTLVGVLAAWVLNRFLRAKTRLIYSLPHSWVFLVDEQLKDAEGKVLSNRQALRTQSVWVKNTSREAAKNVEIALNWKPQFLNVAPARHFETKDSAHDRHSVYLSSLAPGEEFTIEMMAYNRDLPQLVTVRSDECTATFKDMVLQIRYSRIILILVGWLMLAGFGASIYGIAAFIQWIALGAGR